MFTLNPNDYEIAKQQREERLQKAEQSRLVSGIKLNKPPMRIGRKLISILGNCLIKVGKSMQVKPEEARPINTISRPVT